MAVTISSSAAMSSIVSGAQSGCLFGRHGETVTRISSPRTWTQYSSSSSLFFLLSPPLLRRPTRASVATTCQSCLQQSPITRSFSTTRLPPPRTASRKLVCHAAKQSVQDIEEEKEMIELDAMERMEKSLDAVKSNFNTIRTGRASPSLLDRIEVEYYGTPVILKSIAQISTPDGSTLLVTPFDKSSLGGIQKAIQSSDLGLNPSNDGTVIRLNIPQLTADRRKELVKTISKLAEDGKVAMRNVRRDAIKALEKMEKEDKLSKDNVRDASDEIQKLTDDYVKKVDAIFKLKEKEITTV